MNRPSPNPAPVTRLWLIVASALLAACEPSLDVDLVVSPPADAATVSVRVAGVDLERSDGSADARTRSSAVVIEVQRDRQPLAVELIGNGKIDGGEYTGLRLRLADDPGRVLRTGLTPARIEVGSAAVPLGQAAFSVDSGQSDRVSLRVTLDLALSLSEDEDRAGFTLDPLVRVVDTADAASVRGSIPASRFSDASCSTVDSVARVYAFNGRGVTPDERDGEGVEPLATAAIVRLSAAAAASYRLDDLSPGDYTLAFTCQGQLENGRSAATQTLRFFSGGNLTLDPAQNALFNFPS